jgi:hypothetical protein
MFADSWLRSKQPPMSKPSYYIVMYQDIGDSSGSIHR